MVQSLRSGIPDLAAAGITHVWLPPPSQSAAPQGIKSVADRVINYRTAEKQDSRGGYGPSRSSGLGSVVHTEYSDVKGNPDTGEDFKPAPDHLNPRVQNELSDWMNWLIHWTTV